MDPSRIRSLAAAAVAVVSALAAGLVLAPAAAGQDGGERDGRDLIVLSGRTDVPRAETVDTVVVFDGPVRIAGVARGDVVSFADDVTVTGTVEGDVVTFGGRTRVLGGGEVQGDIRHAGSDPVLAPGATVGGEVSEFDPDAFFTLGFGGRLVVWIAFTVSSLVLGLLLLLLAPRAGEAVVAVLRRDWALAAGWGVGVLIGLPVIGVLLLVTLVGIPLGLGILLATGPLYALGYVTSAHVLGRSLVGPPTSPLLAFLAGWAILRALAIIPFVDVISWLLATAFGLGCLTMALWRSRRGRGPTPEAPAAAATGG